MDVALSFPLIQRFVFVPPHGLFIALGFLAGSVVLMREVRRRDLSPDVVMNALTWGAFGSILGARADYVISHPDVFFTEDGFLGSVLAIGKVWEGGLALFGGFIGGVLFALPTLIRNRVHIPRMLDATVPGFALGVAIGRIGDLIIGDHLGDPVTGNPWWKPLTYTIKAGEELAPGFGPSPAGLGDCSIKGQFFADCSYHIPALYDLVGSALIFLFLIWLRRRWAFKSGQLACVWAVLYGCQRILLDFTRSIDERPALGMTGTQLLAILFATICGATLLRTWRRGYGVGDTRDDPPSRAASLHRRAKPGDAAGGVLDSDDDELHDDDDDEPADSDDDPAEVDAANPEVDAATPEVDAANPEVALSNYRLNRKLESATSAESGGSGGSALGGAGSGEGADSDAGADADAGDTGADATVEQVVDQDSGADSDASSTPSAKPLA